MISEWWIGKDVKGSDRGIISGNIPAFAWWDWGNPWETCQDSRSPKLDLKQEPPEYKAVLLTMTFVTYSWYRTLEQWRRSCFVEFKTTFLPWQLLSSCIISGDPRNERHIFQSMLSFVSKRASFRKNSLCFVPWWDARFIFLAWWNNCAANQAHILSELLQFSFLDANVVYALFLSLNS
jgi:hypothetical protein